MELPRQTPDDISNSQYVDGERSLVPKLSNSMSSVHPHHPHNSAVLDSDGAKGPKLDDGLFINDFIDEGMRTHSESELDTFLSRFLI